MKKKAIIILAMAALLAAGFSACRSGGEEAPQKEDRLLAKAYNKSLYLSELDGMIPEGTSSPAYPVRGGAQYSQRP